MKVSVRDWRRVYERAATRENWLLAHRWGYGEDVARCTIEDIREKLRLTREHRVLEVGCGCGAVLAQLLASGQVGVGVDPCYRLFARSADYGVSLENLRPIGGEASHLPLADGVFDRVLCYSVFQCFPDPDYARAALSELLRVCRPGGFILVGDVFNGHLAPIDSPSSRAARALRRRFGLPARILPRAIRSLLGDNGFSRSTSEASIDRIGQELPRQHFSEAFFEGFGRERGCSVEILEQEISGRDLSSWRFDVRIHKNEWPGGDSGGRPSAPEAGSAGKPHGASHRMRSE